MPQDFSNQNLSGRSFKGQNLEGANFSGADIQSTDFTNAILRNANFSQTQAGVQRCWKTLSVLGSWFFLGLSAFFSGTASAGLIIVLQPTNSKEVIDYLVFFTCLTIFLILTNRYGLRKSLGIVAMISLITILSIDSRKEFLGAVHNTVTNLVFIGTSIFAVAYVIAFTFITGTALAIVEAVVGFISFIVATVITFVLTITYTGFLSFFWDGYFERISNQYPEIVLIKTAHLFPGASIIAGIITLFSAYIGWQIIKENEKYSFLRNITIVLTAIGGTSFYNTDLTDADFTQASLESTDFRKANLTRTCFHQVKKLDRVRPGTSYLQSSELREVLITREAPGKNFENKILQGLNLSKVNFAYANLINTNFYQSSLKEANLEGALLVRTQFESTDLTEATLTGACIEDWVVTKTTKLYGVKCKYIFMKLTDKGDKLDSMPLKGEFKNDDFILFVQSILDTIKLYHDRDVNPTLALDVLKSLSENYQCTLEIVKIEKRGESGAIIEDKIPSNFNEEKLKQTYYEKYNQSFKLYMTDPKKELKSPITVHKGFVIAGNVNDSTVADTINQGDTIMSEFSVGGSVGGNVNNVQGDGNRAIQGDNNQGVLGDNNQVTQQDQVGADTGESLTKEDVIKLLAQLETLIQGAELPADTKEEVIEDLSAAKKATDKEEPNKQRALERLGTVAETLEKTSKGVEAGQKIWTTAKPIIVKVATWLGVAAGSHLLGL